MIEGERQHYWASLAGETLIVRQLELMRRERKTVKQAPYRPKRPSLRRLAYVLRHGPALAAFLVAYVHLRRSKDSFAETVKRLREVERLWLLLPGKLRRAYGDEVEDE